MPGICLAASFLLVILFAGSAFSAPVVAAPTRPILTIAQLEKRIANPIRQSGVTVIDLKGFTINLREGENKDFAEQFYPQLQQALNSKGQKDSRYLGVDFSGALVQGDLSLARLSRRIPAYSDALLPELEMFKQTLQPPLSQSSPFQASPFQASPFQSPFSSSFASSERLQNSATYTHNYAKRLSRFLLPSVPAAQPDTLVFQGPLLLNQTCFNGLFDASNLYFLNRVEAQGSLFTQLAQWQAAKFAQNALFSNSQFQQESSFRGAVFLGRTRFNQAQFSGESDWQSAVFKGSTSFAGTDFHVANFARSHWHTNADFEQAKFHATATFQKSRFDQALFLTDTSLEAAVNFRQAQFQQSISLRAAHILGQVDFGDARFARNLPKAVTINVADLDFRPGDAKVMGSAGHIGKLFSVPTLSSNETVLRNLVRNFRLQEQVGDANQLEYRLEQLRRSQIKRQLLGVSLNQANEARLMRIGFSPTQADAITRQAAQRPFVSRADLLSLDEVDLATYVRVRDRITTRSSGFFSRLQQLLRWLALSCLLQLSNYGTNVGLIFSVGMVVVTLFAWMFWLVDRYRRLTPTPIVPGRNESLLMSLSGGSLLAVALSLVIQNTREPVVTLVTISLMAFPVPIILLTKLYQQGRYHDLMDRSYFVENGALRRLQVLIARLPITPKFPFYRERYSPLLTDRRWNFLNYFDFSLNNWFKFGFNDIRLREKCVPGLISALVWYQWSLGVIYITLLLWTLSRTIPGLNLLLYF